MIGLIYGFEKQAEFRCELQRIKDKRKVELIRISFQNKLTFEQRLEIEKSILKLQDDFLNDVYKSIRIGYVITYFFLGMFYYVSVPLFILLETK